MSSSLSQVLVHIVFSTKDRTPWLTDAAVRAELHAYMAGICRNHGAPALSVGGVEDHVHVLVNLGREATISEVVRDLKRSSSKWIKTKGEDLAVFHWQNGYGAFSISPSHADAVREYIRNQEQRHKKESFKDEFRRLLTKNALEFDERYVWD